MGDWQPIETAPKDGTHVLAYVPWAVQPKVLFWGVYCDAWVCPASELGPDPEGWVPTHWLPLPEAPV